MKPIRIGSAFFTIIFIIGVSFGFIFFVYSRYKLIQNQITYGFIGQPSSFNPIIAINNSSDNMISKLLYRSLITFNNKFEPVGDLVDQWQISEDQKTYTLHLKPNQFWQDQIQITTDDVIYTLQTIQNDEQLLRNFPFISNVQINIIDQITISLTIDYVYSPFISLLDFGILPKHIWENIPKDRYSIDINNLKSITSTLYSINFYKITNNKIDNIRITSAKKDNPIIIIRYYNNLDEIKLALKNGEIDSYLDSDSIFTSEFSTYPNFDRYYIPICGETISLYFNLTNKDSVSSNIKFRQSLRELLATVNNNTLRQSLPSDHWVFTKEEQPSSNNDINNLVEQTKLNMSDKHLLIVSANDQWSSELANTIDELLTRNKILHTLQLLNIDEIRKNILPDRKFDILIIPQRFNQDPDQYVFWHSTQTDLNNGLNISGYNDRRMDKALEVGRKSFDLNERRTQYQIMQDRLSQDLPAVFITFPTLTSYIRINHPKLNINTCLWDSTDFFTDIYNQ